jgi:N-acetylglucosaminyl-diphospho-decaprenol L-rhamnosyltransferase
MDLSIIIVNWNSTEYARECIGSIYEHTRGVAFEVIVVDNASPADDVDGLKDEFPGITLVKSGENLGFARANNLGVTKAKGEILLFLNPDTKLIQPALEAMVEAMRSRPDAGALGCKLLNGDLSVQTSCIQTFPTILNQALDAEALRRRWPGSRLWGTAALGKTGEEASEDGWAGARLDRLTIGPQVTNLPHNKNVGMSADVAGTSARSTRVEVVSGACLMIRRDVFMEVGMFSEDYFMYAEDLDLCRKTVRAGYRNYYTGAARLIHYGGGSSVPGPATVMKWRSMLHYCGKHHGKAYTFLFRVVMAVVAMGRLAVLAAGAAAKRPGGRSAAGYSAADKWKTILGVLVSGAGGERVRAPRPPRGTRKRAGESPAPQPTRGE